MTTPRLTNPTRPRGESKRLALERLAQGPATAEDVEALLGHKRAAAWLALEGLVRAGLARRTDPPYDGRPRSRAGANRARAPRYSITPRGRAVLGAAWDELLSDLLVAWARIGVLDEVRDRLQRDLEEARGRGRSGTQRPQGTDGPPGQG